MCAASVGSQVAPARNQLRAKPFPPEEPVYARLLVCSSARFCPVAEKPLAALVAPVSLFQPTQVPHSVMQPRIILATLLPMPCLRTEKSTSCQKALDGAFQIVRQRLSSDVSDQTGSNPLEVMLVLDDDNDDALLFFPRRRRACRSNRQKPLSLTTARRTQALWQS